MNVEAFFDTWDTAPHIPRELRLSGVVNAGSIYDALEIVVVTRVHWDRVTEEANHLLVYEPDQAIRYEVRGVQDYLDNPVERVADPGEPTTYLEGR